MKSTKDTKGKEPQKESGSHRRGAAMTIKEVARRAKVSSATVSRVMNGVSNRVSDETASRVLKTIEEMNYRPSRAGSALRRGTSHSVALMVPQLSSMFNVAIATSIEASLRKQGKVMLLCGTEDDPDVQDGYLSEMRAQAACGIVMLGAVKSPGLDAALKAGEPIVFVNRRAPSRFRAPFVGIDNMQAGEDVGVFFRERGYRDVAVIHTPLSSSATGARVNGFLSGLGDGIDKPRMVSVRTHTKENGYAAARKIFAERVPQAVFCSTDDIAYGVARCCKEYGLTLQEDIMLFGFDGNPLNSYLAPWLNTVEVPYSAYGAAVCQMLDGYSQDHAEPAPSEVIFPYKIVIAGG